MAEWLVGETQNLLIAVKRRSSPRPSRMRLISIFVIALCRAAFCRVLLSVCEAKFCICVKITEYLQVFQNKRNHI